MVTEFGNLVINRLPELWLRVSEHLFLTGASTVIAILVGVPLGILATRSTVTWLRGLLVSTINMVQTIPSLAMLAILLVILGKIGTLPAVIALILYALLPIVRNTITGLENVPSEIIEAARGIGMTKRQELWLIRVPLSIKVIITGIRTAAVTGVGIATLSAFIGAGGLGQFINRGIALSNTSLILLGAIPAAILALIIDFSIGAVEWGLQPARSIERNLKRKILKPIALCLPFLLAIAGGMGYFSESILNNSIKEPANSKKGIIRIGSKNFTEQLILGELIAELIESKTDLSVERHFNLGGTMICHNALLKGEIDIYPEYTGTALTTILNMKAIKNPDKTLQVVRQYYRDRFNIEWLSPFGFNNTYTITVRETDAKHYELRNISDLENISSRFRAGFTSEFAERPDGYPGLRKSYGFSFKEVKDIDPSMMYEAIKKKEIDVISAFATDGRIKAYNLTVLTDDLTFFPPYYAAALIRIEVLQVYPKLRKTLALLTGLIDDNVMQQLNYEVDENKQSPENVAREFLILNDLIN